MNKYLLALGSNLNNPEKQLVRALAALHSQPDIAIIDYSSLYKSPALIDKNNLETQPDFLNMLAIVHTSWYPEKLFSWITIQEYLQGRVRNYKWQSRPLDIDIIFYNTTIYKSNRLIIPHPEMHKRNFVMQPIEELSQKDQFFFPLFLKIKQNGITQSTCQKLHRIIV